MSLSNPLQYRNGDLYFDDTKLEIIADKIPTPFYLYSERSITENYLTFQNAALKHKIPNPMICYALKANPNAFLLNALAKLGAGADIVSGGELKRAMETTISPNKIIFSGVGKTTSEIETALQCGVYSFNIESYDELEEINSRAKQLGLVARIAFRLNPKVETKTHKNIRTGSKYHKFGILEQEILKLLSIKKLWAHAKLVGLSMHIGSQLYDLDATIKALRALCRLYMKIKQPLEFIDVGGGLGIPYTFNDKNKYPSSDYYMKIIAQELDSALFDKLDPNQQKPSIIFEPGRVIAASAGILVTRVIRTKKTAGHHFTIIDAGLNDFLRPSLYKAFHQILPAHKKSGKKIITNVVGPVCETTDQFAENISMQTLNNGDLLAIKDAGAYGQIMSSNYNLRKTPKEVILAISGGIIS